jgi:hypothetical protein
MWSEFASGGPGGWVTNTDSVVRVYLSRSGMVGNKYGRCHQSLPQGLWVTNADRVYLWRSWMVGYNTNSVVRVYLCRSTMVGYKPDSVVRVYLWSSGMVVTNMDSVFRVYLWRSGMVG